METINANEINVSAIEVATYNADPFAVETEEQMNDIRETLEAAGTVDVYTKADDEFETLAAMLDYSLEDAPAEIYVVNGNELTFAMR